MIISLILTTFSVDCVLVLLGETWCWSLLGLEGLSFRSQPNASAVYVCSQRFFVWEINSKVLTFDFKNIFCCNWRSSGWSLKTSSTLFWAAWSHIKSSRIARRCNSTWGRRKTYIKGSEERLSITPRNQTEFLIMKCYYKLTTFRLNNSASLACQESEL